MPNYEKEHTLDLNQMPNHTHAAYIDRNFSAVSNPDANYWKQMLINTRTTPNSPYNVQTNHVYAHDTSNHPLSLMNPYHACYIWRRTN